MRGRRRPRTRMRSRRTTLGSSGSETFTIAPKSVTASFTAANKVYDGTTAATVQGTVVGKLTGDTVNLTGGVAAFQNKNAGTGKTVDISGFVLSGASAGNYTLVARAVDRCCGHHEGAVDRYRGQQDDGGERLGTGSHVHLRRFRGRREPPVPAESRVPRAVRLAAGRRSGSSDIVCVVGDPRRRELQLPARELRQGQADCHLCTLTGNCFGAPGHAILQPIDADNSSIFKQGSTVPAKFRVCDANGNSISTAGVVQNFRLVSVSNGVSGAVDEPVDSTTPDVAFRWSSSDQQWIFNINTKSLSANKRYTYEITLNDDSKITFAFGLK